MGLLSTPTDALFGQQWHLRNTGQTGGVAGVDVNVLGAWSTVLGRGVRIGIVDDGFDLTHPDLAGRFSTTLGWDAVDNDLVPAAGAGNNHGTAVASVLGAGLDGQGLVGVAPDATLVGYRVAYGNTGTVEMFASQLRRAAETDVVNNSWGYTGFFADNFRLAAYQPLEAALEYGVSEGRGGLGTVYVFAAGNSRQSGDNVNHHDMQNAPEVITVAALDASGKVASFSTPGAALLVSAPGVAITTADRSGSDGYVAGDSVVISGTSFAAPIVTGVVALMLEANPGLGWRDVQEILAYTARQVDPTGAWTTNHAGDFNGGGLHFSNDYGFGLVDAAAAVRLAESWDGTATSDDLRTASGSASPKLSVDGYTRPESRITIADDIRIDKVEVRLDLRHSWIGEVSVTLVSPSGTESLLINQPGKAPGGTGYGYSTDDIRFTMSSNAFWGENSAGAWKLQIRDSRNGNSGTFESWTLTVYGDDRTADDRHIFTDEFVTLAAADAARTVISGVDGGSDSLNLAAVTYASNIDLGAGTGAIGGRVLTINGSIETVIGGAGDDRLAGDAAANRISGGDGADNLSGAAGNDVLEGGAANDSLSGGEGTDQAVFDGLAARFSVEQLSGSVRVTDLAGLLGADLLQGIETLVFQDRTLTLGVPVVAPMHASSREDEPLELDLATQAAGVGAVTSIGRAANGTLNLAADGTVAYTPKANWSGTDSFTYTVRTSSGGTVTGLVTIEVAEVNDAPLAHHDRFALDAGAAAVLDVLANDSDEEGDALALVSAVSSSGATLTLLADGRLAYDSRAGFAGTDIVTYVVTDGALTSVGTAEVEVVAVDAAARLFVSNTMPSAGGLKEIGGSGPVTLTGAQLGLTGIAGAATIEVLRSAGSSALTLTSDWNSIKSAAVTDADGGTIVVRNFVEANVTAGGTSGSRVTVADGKRGTIITGAGDDVLDIAVKAGMGDGSTGYNIFTLHTDGGDDRVTVAGDRGYTLVRAEAGAGADLMALVGTGASSLAGGEGADTLIAASGSDTLQGGRDDDRLTGGTGRDQFLFAAGDGADIITDFDASGSDRLRILDVAAAAVWWEAVHGGTLVHVGTVDTILLQNVAVASVGAADFIFA